MAILLDWIIERIFYYVKTRKPLFFELGEALNGLRLALWIPALGRGRRSRPIGKC
jgi:hypothetical protein